MRLHQLMFNRTIILAGIILFSMACIYPSSAADYAVVSRQMQSVQSTQTNQMLVTVTSDPATYTPGSSCTIHVVVTLNQNPYPTSIPVQISASDSQITITPYSRGTDSSGSFYATLTTTSSTSGVIHVQAQASDLYCGGVSAAPNQQCTVTSAVGSVDIPQQEQAKPQARVYYVSTTPTPVAYQPPVNQPQVNQPPVQPQVNQPQQQAGNQPPVAVISVDKYAGNAGLTVNFDARKSYAPGGSIRTYTWNFGDGSSGNGYVAQHQYSIPGTYTASLVVTDNNELSSTPATTQITVWSPIVAPVYNVGGPCDDGNPCTVNDHYDNAGNCGAGQPLNCDDNNPNTVDTCNSATGCINTPITSIPPENPAAQPMAVPSSVPTIPVKDCMKITTSGYYTLENDIPATQDKLTVAPGDMIASCIDIEASGVTFDGKYHHISIDKHESGTYGIFVNALGATTPSISNVVIKDVDISNWFAGIEFWDTNGGSISGCTIHDNKALISGSGYASSNGIALANAKNIEITNNIITKNDVGIWVKSLSTENTIGGLPPCQNPDKPTPPSSKKNDISNNNWFGIWLANSNNNHIIGNTISGSVDNNNYIDPSGIHFQGSSNNEIISNTISGNYHGNYLEAESTADNFDKNTMNNNHDNFYVSKDSGYSSIPVEKTCEVISQAPLMIAESQVHCTIMGFFTGQCGSDWTKVFTIFGSHPTVQTTPSGSEGTQQRLMNVQGAENQNEGIVAGIINFPSRTIQGLIGPSAGSQESQTTAKPVEQGGRPLPVICAGNGCLKPVANSNPGNPVSGLPEATISPTIPPASNCTGNLSCKNQVCNCMCTDLNNDNANCGSCGNVCNTGQSCVSGQCISFSGHAIYCPSGTVCGISCVDTQNDNNNCGSCGNVCRQGLNCIKGVCTCPLPPCP